MCAIKDKSTTCANKLSIYYYLEETETGSENNQNRCELWIFLACNVFKLHARTIHIAHSAFMLERKCFIDLIIFNNGNSNILVNGKCFTLLSSSFVIHSKIYQFHAPCAVCLLCSYFI